MHCLCSPGEVAGGNEQKEGGPRGKRRVYGSERGFSIFPDDISPTKRTCLTKPDIVCHSSPSVVKKLARHWVASSGAASWLRYRPAITVAMGPPPAIVRSEGREFGFQLGGPGPRELCFCLVMNPPWPLESLDGQQGKNSLREGTPGLPQPDQKAALRPLQPDVVMRAEILSYFAFPKRLYLREFLFLRFRTAVRIMTPHEKKLLRKEG